MRLSPGTVVYPLEPTHSGHLLLPCSEFGRRPADKVITLLSGANVAETGVAQTQTTTVPEAKVADSTALAPFPSR